MFSCKEIISGTQNIKDIKKLSYERKVAIREEGPNSDRAKRIEDMISDKNEDLRKQLDLIAKSLQKYNQQAAIENDDNKENTNTDDNSKAMQF